MTFRDLVYKIFNKLFFHGFYLKSYSQDGEDLILYSFLKYQPSGFFVDVGAHHPFRFSNTFIFYKKGWKGINIDAAPGSMKLFKKHRPRDINLEVGISDKPETKEFYIFDEPAINSFDKTLSNNRASKKNVKITRKESIQLVTLNEILSQNNVGEKDIDFLTIDAEGYDFKVIKSVDLTVYKPKIIVVETEINFLDPGSNEIVSYLLKYNYKIIAKTKRSLFFSSNENLK